MRNILFFVVIFFSMISQSSYASPLDDARDSGQIVELATGYVQAIPGAPADIKALAADVNKRRKEAYQRIAKKNGITEAQVAAESYKKRTGN